MRLRFPPTTVLMSGLLGLSLVCLAVPAIWSEEPPKPAENPLADPAFKDLDLADLLEAIQDGDTARLIELASQLRKAEKATGAKHKGASSATLFATAFRTASFQQDNAGLKKLAEALDPKSDAELLGQVNETLKLSAPRRAPSEKLTFSEDEIQSGVYATYKTVSDNITLYASIGDRQGLSNVKEGMFNGTALPDRVAKVLTARLQVAMDSLPEKSDADATAMAKLLDASRGATGTAGAKGPITVSWLPGVTNLAPCWDYRPASVGKTEFVYDRAISFTGVPAANKKAWDYCNSRLGRKMGSGLCAGVPEEAFTSALGRKVNTGLGPNNLYGKLIATITPSDKSGAAKILPGDMLQTEFATYAASYTTSAGTQSWTSSVDKASQHIAVVRAVKNSGRIIDTFEQNINSIQITMISITNLDWMKTGRIWVLRAQ